MNNLPELPSRYRSWVDFYLQVEAEVKSQGLCNVPDELEVEIQWQENLFVDVDRDLPMAERFWAAEQKSVRVKMRDVKMEIFEMAMDIFRKKQALQSLEHSVLLHVPPSAPQYLSFCRLLSFINKITGLHDNAAQRRPILAVNTPTSP